MSNRKVDDFMAIDTNLRSKVFLLLLYPDEDVTHLKALEYIKANYDYAGICQDKDIYLEDTETNGVLHKAGELKKTHYHIVVRFKNARWLSGVANELGISDNFIRVSHNFIKSLLYLVHYYESDKYQYSPEEVFGSLKTRFKEAYSSEGKSESEKVLEIFAEIDKCEYKIDFSIFVKHIALIGYWDVLRRSSSLILRYLDTHNMNFRE